MARGRPAEPGTDARLEYYFEVESRPHFSPGAERVNFRELNLIQNVEAGDLLAEKIDATPGQPGRSVRGDSIPAPGGQDHELCFGENVRREGNRLFADTDGQVVMEDGRVVVREIHRIQGDVDYSTGNVQFNGTVRVEGQVRDRFRIQAAGDIYVEEGVGKAFLQSDENIVIRGGVLGKQGGQIIAGGDVVAEFMDQAHVIARGNVLVEEMIMHSRVDAGEGIYVAGSRGLLAGGRSRASYEIYAREIGSVGSSRTLLEAGVNPSYFRDLSEIETKILNHRDKSARIQRALNTLGARDDLSGGEREKLDTLRETHQQIQQTITNLEEKQQALTRNTLEVEGARVIVDRIARTGTRLTIGGETYYIQHRPREHCTFRKTASAIQIESYQDPHPPPS